MLSIKFEIASPETILSWSYGEVCNSGCLDGGGKPIMDGLFCPKIFGSRNKHECLCETPTLTQSFDCMVCHVCLGGNKTKLRSRFGHVNLATPVVHTLFYKTMPNILGSLLSMDVGTIRDLIGCKLHVIKRCDTQEFEDGQIISTEVYRRLWMEKRSYEVVSGGVAILLLLSKVQLKETKQSWIDSKHNVKSREILEDIDKNIEVVDGFINNKVSLDLMVIKVLPVLPVELRPSVVLDGNKSVSSDLNELYKGIINANNVVIANIEGQRDGVTDFDEYVIALEHLQRNVDSLIDNSQGLDGSMGYNNVALKSLTEMLKGKRGMFRLNILGKRVDYSGRSVIVPGPSLSINECAIPRSMAAELFKPFIHSKLMLDHRVRWNKAVAYLLDCDHQMVYKILEEIVKYCPVLLNRAPTLHKLSMRSFWVKLTNEKVIRLHPLVCAGFNADFDGDQMAVHVPLSQKARIEATTLLMAGNNVLHPAHGDPCVLPSQDMILGLYYMSLTSSEQKNICFTSYSEVITALAHNKVGLHTKVRFTVIKNHIRITLFTTPGRLLISKLIPNKCGFIYEWNHPGFNKQFVYDVIEMVNKTCGWQQMVEFCERLMRLGFKYATQSGLSLSRSEFDTSDYKNDLLKQVRSIINKAWSNVCNKSKLPMFWPIWHKILANIYDNIDLKVYDNSLNQMSIQMIVNSGARSTLSQTQQLLGSRGYVVDFDGQRSRMPILNSYNEGLSLIQFFCCTYSSRRGLMDTALKTANSGYLTRKLVESTREWVIDEVDCCAKDGLGVEPIIDLEFIKNRLIGRYLVKNILSNGKIIARRNELITATNISEILTCCGNQLWIRSPLTCQAKSGVCKLCYGVELSSGNMAQYGEPVGVLAAQSIGEPGTQLTLRTFHGLTETEANVHSQNFEGCLMSPLSGVVKIEHLSCVCSNSCDIIVSTSKCVLSVLRNTHEIWSYKLSWGTRLLVNNGKNVNIGEVLCFNSIGSNNILVLTNGIITFEDLKYGLNLTKSCTDPSNLVKRSIKTKLLNNKIPLVCLNIGTHIKLCWSSVWDKLDCLVKPGSDVNIFDILFEVMVCCANGSKPTLIEGFERLSKLFDNSIAEDNAAVICGTDSVLRYGTDGNGDETFVIDPVRLDERPLVFSDVNVKPLVGNNGRMKQGWVVISGENDLMNYAEAYGFNNLYNYFVETVQEIYGQQGVSVNGKHIEMVLRQMMNITSICDSGNSTLSVNKHYDWQDFARINRYVNTLAGKVAVGRRKIVGVTECCTNKNSILSTVSFQGSIKTILKAIISGNDYRITDIKDRIILGKLPFVGTGFIMNKTQRTRYPDDR
ncbi:DNA-directed RNA polymerase subunit beta' [Candidatus Hodgkinia cicadicola]|uniref:DNA-directed RNA polymerase subunit n=1 Tax=Candidatus Hodgkinia cicadicola TaxID=573658 RepID=A0ABX4MF35_9HYPH|nr:DNA-directed RNA polymerase subunit beta' [Candidatus Hodgkinia cicadicola]